MTTENQKKNGLCTSDSDLLTYDPLGACTGMFVHKLYG